MFYHRDTNLTSVVFKRLFFRPNATDSKYEDVNAYYIKIVTKNNQAGYVSSRLKVKFTPNHSL